MIRCSCGNALVSIEAICEACFPHGISRTSRRASSQDWNIIAASLELVERLSQIYTVDTDQCELIALVVEAQQIIRKRDKRR